MENWVWFLFSTKWHGLFESPLGCSSNSNCDKRHFAGSPIWIRRAATKSITTALGLRRPIFGRLNLQEQFSPVHPPEKQPIAREHCQPSKKRLVWCAGEGEEMRAQVNAEGVHQEALG